MRNYAFSKVTYLRRNQAGEIVAREEVDPTTIWQLLDEHGETPKPPYPAYQQRVDGVPVHLFLADELEVEPYQEEGQETHHADH